MSSSKQTLKNLEKLENLRISSEKIDRAAWDFKTGSVIEPEPDVYKYTGRLSEPERYVIMLPEVDIKSRWHSECEGTSRSGFLYSDELKLLSRLSHENILPFIGYCDEKDVFLQHDVHADKAILVFETGTSYGILAKHIQKHRHSEGATFQWARRLEICIGIAKGINYLHSGVEGVGRVIHNNIQSKNIMLTTDLEPKIMGFYHSVILPENQPHTQVNAHVRNEHHPDPIYHEIGLLDTTTDVYSYGILMFELLIWMLANEEKVIGDYKPQRLINIVRQCYDNKPEQLIDHVLRDHIDPRSFRMFINIAYICISFNFKDRPTMDEVAKELTKALDIHKRAPSPSGDLRPTHENIEKFYIPLEEMQLAIRNSQKITGCRFYRTDLFFYQGQKGPVALKEFNDDDYSFKAKLEIVSRLQHKNIIQFIGAPSPSGYFSNHGVRHLVYECADNGSLSTYLHKLTWDQRLKICIGAANGLKYLHSGIGEYESVIHGEFGSQNILISDNLEAKICGLDSSFLVPRNNPDTKVYKTLVGSQEMDPVYRESYIPKVESNVYSLGVVLFEILTGKLVDTKCDGDEELSLMALVRRHYGDEFDKFIDPKIRDEIDVRSLHIFKEIAYRCISYQIKDRPSMNKIIKRLEEALYIQEHSLRPNVTGRSLPPQKLADFFIPLSDINFAIGANGQTTQIGDGGFGVVYKGQPLERWQNKTVAIKCLHPDSNHDSNHVENAFLNELNMIFHLSHENIIPFIGYCDEGNEKIIVYEYASNGSLDYHLEDEEKRRKLKWVHRLKICLGAARGLDYLHSGLGKDKRVIHRDVKSGNILLDHNFEAKVCDFGLSKSGPINQQDTEVYTNVAGTNYYMDPVYHGGGVLRKESDVYSFGVVMFELLSGLPAYRFRELKGDGPKPLLHNVRRYYASTPELLIDPMIKHKIDDRSFSAFKEVAFQCISFNSKERPTMEAIADRVEEALELQVINQGDLQQKVTES